MNDDIVRLEVDKVWTGDGYGSAEAVLLHQIKRQGNICLYSASKVKTPARVTSYEVFIVKVVKAGTVFPGGVVVEKSYESYPRAESFGKTAWSVNTIGRAEYIFDELLKANSEQEANDELVSIPGEFTCSDLATQKGIAYAEAMSFIKENLGKTIKLHRTGRKEGQTRGKPSNFYVNI